MRSIRTIDATQSLEEVTRAIQKTVTQWLQEQQRMKWYPWLRPHFENLIESYQAGRGHHALLIQALPGMGDDALIYAITPLPDVSAAARP